MSAVISGIGVYYPDKILNNFDLEKMVETSDEWITARTGIKERRIVPEDSGVTASDMGTRASLQALEKAGIKPEQIDGIITAGANPDMQFPATACFIQHKIGARGFAYDVTAACAGFVVGLNIASLMINSGQCRNILVVGTELLSQIVDWTDRNTCILFGDGAGAVVVTPCDDPDRGIINSVLESDGSAADILYMNTHFTKKGDSHCIEMDGKQVFKLAVRALTDIVTSSLQKEGLTAKDLDLAIFHQANIRILNAVAKNLGLPEEKVYINGHKFGNTSSASIPLALYDAEQDGLLQPGKLLAFAAIGGGMSWGCNLVRW